ncbi:MAG: hypothetical protein H6733_06185 [Alphaproteobacteria bacterium]|nr:hypothetical protein [Alphaproteobacteria bacterium]
MSQPFDQLAFFDAHWPTLRAAAESTGGDGVIATIQAFADPLERRVLYAFARRGLVQDTWDGKDLDVPLAVARAGIDELVAQAADADTETTRAARLNVANVIAYNLAADLADCWPGDDLPRTEAHFTAGLAAAERAVAWRHALARGDHALGMAEWARGYHLLRLGRTAEAADAFATSLGHYRRAAGTVPDELSQAPFGVVLLTGYLGLAQRILGEEGPGYDAARDAFRAGTGDDADDDRFGFDQLTVAALRCVGS